MSTHNVILVVQLEKKQQQKKKNIEVFGHKIAYLDI